LQTRYVVDTTILVSWLLDPNKLTGKIVKSLELELHTPYQSVSELWKHRDDWSKRRPGLDLSAFADSIGRYVGVETVEKGSGEMNEARSAMGRIDPDDVEFVALAIKIDAPIWSHDKHFLEQKRVAVVTSQDILKQSVALPSLWQALHDEFR
jgi:predicted nucleic acid-binding protein